MILEKQMPYEPDKEALFRHVKSGNIYRFLGLATLESDLSDVVIYQNVGTNRIWVRPAEEFYDGRFLKIPSEK